jgi:hypothetical protein
MPAEPKQELPRVEGFKPSAAPAQELPPEVVDKSFSLDDFEVEQLPKQTPEVKEEKKIEVKETTPKVEVKETKSEGAESKEEVTGEGEGEETPPAKEEKKLPKYLKPPVAKKEDPAGVKPITPPVGKVIRNYEGYTTEQVQAFKQMSDSAYKMTTDLIKHNKELQGKSSQTYLQHPQAYVLDPEFQETRSQLTFAQREAQYWEGQLINLTENGADVIPITGWDKATGEPIKGQPIKGSKMIEERLRRMIGSCEQVGQTLRGKLEAFPQKYKSQIEEGVKGLRDFDSKSFAWEQDPSLLEYSVAIDGLGDRSLKQVKEDVRSMVPAWLHDNPLLPTLQNVVIALRLKQAELQEINSSAATERVLRQEDDRVEPSSKTKPSASGRGKGPKVHGIEEFRIDPSLGI